MIRRVSRINAGGSLFQQGRKLDARENWPVFVHCQRGADRTGVVIAAYRISHEKWTDEQAITEAKRFGLAVVQFRKKDYISDYYKRRSKDE